MLTDYSIYCATLLFAFQNEQNVIQPHCNSVCWLNVDVITKLKIIKTVYNVSHYMLGSIIK
jgi:hypothetical protein